MDSIFHIEHAVFFHRLIEQLTLIELCHEIMEFLVALADASVVDIADHVVVGLFVQFLAEHDFRHFLPFEEF